VIFFQVVGKAEYESWDVFRGVRIGNSCLFEIFDDMKKWDGKTLRLTVEEIDP